MQNFSARFEELRQSYMSQLVEKAAQMADAWRQVETGEVSVDICEELQQAAHNLAGTGSTFGFPEVSSTAHELEVALRQILGGARSEGVIADAGRLVRGLQQLVAGFSASGAAAVSAPEAPVAPRTQWVYFLSEAVDEAEALATQLAHFGYESYLFTDPDALAD
ncbi:MAG: diguanylate cyclase, partial [Oscillochloris sp.]|nr:diguanylate cyclase [Oscillochloris sp.]